MNSRERLALERLLAYNWQDEQRDFEEQDEHGRAGHIFPEMMLLQQYLDRYEWVEGEVDA